MSTDIKCEAPTINRTQEPLVLEPKNEKTPERWKIIHLEEPMKDLHAKIQRQKEDQELLLAEIPNRMQADYQLQWEAYQESLNPLRKLGRFFSRKEAMKEPKPLPNIDRGYIETHFTELSKKYHLPLKTENPFDKSAKKELKHLQAFYRTLEEGTFCPETAKEMETVWKNHQKLTKDFENAFGELEFEHQTALVQWAKNSKLMEKLYDSNERTLEPLLTEAKGLCPECQSARVKVALLEHVAQEKGLALPALEQTLSREEKNEFECIVEGKLEKRDALVQELEKAFIYVGDIQKPFNQESMKQFANWSVVNNVPFERRDIGIAWDLCNRQTSRDPDKYQTQKSEAILAKAQNIIIRSYDEKPGCFYALKHPHMETQMAMFVEENKELVEEYQKQVLEKKLNAEERDEILGQLFEKRKPYTHEEVTEWVQAKTLAKELELAREKAKEYEQEQGYTIGMRW